MHYWCVVQSVTIGAYQSLHPLRDTVLYVITLIGMPTLSQLITFCQEQELDLGNDNIANIERQY